MAEEFKIIWLLAIGLGLACVLGYLAHLVKTPPILGYLLAGYLIGPYSPGFVADVVVAGQLANIGITLLMFVVGLHFNWKNLESVKSIALPGAVILSLLSIAIPILYSLCIHQSVVSGFVIGLAVCVSSTVVMVRILTDQGLIETRQGHIVVGWTIVEDLISVFGLILLPIIYSFATQDTPGESVRSLQPFFLLLLKIALLGVVLRFAGKNLLDRVLSCVARTRSHELFTLAVLCCVFLIAIGSSYIFNVSLALGAFIAGTLIGETSLSHQAAANALPMRDSFSVIFFLSVGMLFNPAAVANNPKLFFGILSIIILIRPILAFLIMTVARYPIHVALTVSLAIAQIGEYSFIVAEEGNQLGILPHTMFDILIACSCISIGLNPILLQLFRPICSKMFSWPSHEQTLFSYPPLMAPTDAKNEMLAPRAIIIGFGPVGQKVFQYLVSQRFQVLVIDQNIDTVHLLKKDNIETIFGDACQSHILEKARIKDSIVLAITIPDFHSAKAIIQIAQDTNPFIKVIARSRFKQDSKGFESPTISIVCDEEASSEQFVSVMREQLA